MVRINLLGRKKRLRLKPIHIELTIFAVILAVVLTGVYLVDINLNSRIKVLKDEITVVDGRLSKLKGIKKEIDGFEKTRDMLLNKIRVVMDLKRSQKGYYTIFTKLEKSMPKDVWINNLNFKGDAMSMQCSSLKFVSVNEFIVKLFEDGMFSGIDIDYAKKNDVENVEINNFMVNTSVNMEQ